MDNIQSQNKNLKEKIGNSNNRLSNEQLKRKTNYNDSKFKKFCGDTDFMLNLPSIDGSLKFLKHETDNSILNFNYNTMLLNEKIERLNDVERNVSIPMELPFLYSFNLENNDDIKNWINEQNLCEKEKKNSKLLNNVYLNDKMKEFSSYLPVVKSFEKEDFDLLNTTIPNYFKSIRNNILANEEKKNKEIDKNYNAYDGASIDNANMKIKNKINLYNHYFEHPLKKYLKIKKIYPVIPYITIWKNKYIQGIMEIESSQNNIKNKNNENSKSYKNDNKETKRKSFIGLLHLIEKSRDKHIYSLYKKHEINIKNQLLKKVHNKENNDIKGNIENIKKDNDIQLNKNEGDNNNKQKKKISLSKFLIKKHILKLRRLEKLKNISSKELKNPHTTDNKEEFLSKRKTNYTISLSQINKSSSFNETYQFKQIKKNIDENNEKNEMKNENISLSNIENSINKNLLDENVQLFKYVRDYKSPSFKLNQNDTLSYAIGFSKNNLGLIFPTLSKKIIFSKTGHQKRKNYILLKE